jgi:hypothetical protein
MSEIKVNKISPRSGTTLTLGDSGDDFIIPAGATLTNNGTASGFASIAWQSTIVTGSTLTAVAGNGYWIDTTLNACTVTLPASASVGDQIILVDYDRTWGTNNLTINANSLNYQGYSSSTGTNPIYNTSGQSVSIVYSGATQGWIPTTDDDVTWKSVPPPYSVDFLVIAGGGGANSGTGPGYNGGGGGAGGYRNSYNSESSGGGGPAETSLTFNVGTVYTITVGAGGAAGTGNTATNGGDSSISGSDITTITSTGGGEGASDTAGVSGGSGGGGASGGGSGSTTAGGGTANQGYGGGIGYNNPPFYNAGGGGGAGEAGNTDANGYGGDGVASTITGSSVTRGGGGAGSSSAAPQPLGGDGGGGNGGYAGNAGTAGTANTGGGGGGGQNSAPAQGYAGGSGVVILRMADGSYSGTTTGSPTVTTGVDGTDTVLVFNASGSYTA